MITIVAYEKKIKTYKYTTQRVKALLKSKTPFWIDLENPEYAQLQELGKIFKWHDLLVEDVYSTGMRPKLEVYKHFVYLVTYGVERKKQLHTHEVDFVAGKTWLVTVHKGERFGIIKSNPAMLKDYFKSGIDRVVHTILDRELDYTMSVLDHLGDSIGDVEDEVIAHADHDCIHRILHLKRELMRAKKVLLPQREVISQLLKHSSKFVKEASIPYYRDLYDHMLVTLDRIDTQREMLSSVLEVHLSVISHRMNEVMKVLTVIATIMLPVTAIGSIYGMNFRYMPELAHPYGYYAVLAFMGFVTLGMLWYFKRKKWI